MGNRGSSGRRRNNSLNHQPPPPPQPMAAQPPEATGNRYVFAAATPYPAQYPPPNVLPPPLQHQQLYHQYGAGYYNPPPPSVAPMPLPVPFDPHHRIASPHRYPYGHMPPPPVPMPYVEHQKAVTIRNDVNLKKESLRMVPDDENPGKFLVAFTFDATTAGSITVLFFAKEGIDCDLTPTKEELVDSVTISFNEGLGQKFRQPSGTGINLSMFEEAELTKEGGMEVYPLAVKADAFPPVVKQGTEDDGEEQKTGTPNSQITQAVFEKKENGEYRVRVVKQILWVNGTRYELQEIYGIGNSVDGDFDGSDPGKECVICLSEPRDTTVLPCRHMCMCSECAKVLRFQTNRCPICRQPVERLLEIRVNNSSNSSGSRGEEQLKQQEAP